MIRRLQLPTIRAKLIFWFLIVAVIPLLLFSLVFYLLRVQSTKAEAYTKLEAIRDLKVQRINTWLDEIASDMETMAASTRPAAAVRNAQPVREELDHFVRAHTSYTTLTVIDVRTERVLASTDRRIESEDRSTFPYFMEVRRTGKFHVSDIALAPGAGIRCMTVAYPIADPGAPNHVVAVVVADIDLVHVDMLLQERTGMGQTGETLIVNREVIALNELRWRPDAPLKLKIAAAPSVLAAEGETGVVESRDYRGTPVLAAYTHIPRLNWGFVAKQDLAELYRPITNWLLVFAAMFPIAILLVAGLAGLLARTFSRPILDLQATADAVRGGDLRARNLSTRADELGKLALAFDEMADAVQHQVAVLKDSQAIAETMVRAVTPTDFCRDVLHVVMQATQSDIGAFYVLGEDGHLTAAASLGASIEALAPFDAQSMEGALGMAMATRRPHHLRELPEDTRFTFRTVAGTAIPREMLTVPVMVDHKVVAIIALATLRSYAPVDFRLVDESLLALGIGFGNLLAQARVERMASELAVQNTELEAQTAELAAQTTEIQRQADVLHEQNAELEVQAARVAEANRLKSEFLSNMSHELRTPLNSVLALSRVLAIQGQESLTEEQLGYLEIIERNGKHLLALINDILDLAKIESGKADIESSDVALRGVIGDLVDSLTPICREKDVALVAHIAADLPPIVTDPRRLQIILQNILGNAVKFTLAGQVAVAARRLDDAVEITVTDTGIGIPAEELPHIFDEFRQVDGGTARSFEGTGLGLAIAAKSVRMLGGRITAISETGVGSTFTVTLPLDIARTGRAVPVAAELLAPACATDTRTVLVVDDAHQDAQRLADCLTDQGYRAMIAHSGGEALILAALHRPFAITLDVVMPDMDGWEVLQALKRNPVTAQIPVIIVSVAEDRATGLALGAKAVIARSGHTDRHVEEQVCRILREMRAHPTPAPDGCGNRLLLVDDNEPAIIQMTQMLHMAGYQVDVARGGEEALRMMGTPPPDGIILDLMMPEVDGFAVLDELRGSPATAHLPVLILTAKNLTSEDLGRLKANHIQQLVQKGDVDRQELLTKIARMLGRKPEVVAPPAPRAPRAASPRPPIIGRQAVVLAIEDNPDNMRTVQAILGEQYDVREAVDGELGLRAALEQRPDVILLDISLPKVDGLTVARRLREAEQTRDIPVIALTAHAMKGDRETALAAGCDDYLTKPIDVEQLRSTIARWLGVSEHAEEDGRHETPGH